MSASDSQLGCVSVVNLFQEFILKIHPEYGVVLQILHFPPNLYPKHDRMDSREAVLNGIAYDADNQLFYLTGKLWSKMFTVSFT
mmetsp:Transcript_1182/g.1556  ORF Transcript_1182/g.1556 Transcript_1182/m.1556 type:complete len:84 (-) Transcript_1182:22-273(-)